MANPQEVKHLHDGIDPSTKSSYRWLNIVANKLNIPIVRLHQMMWQLPFRNRSTFRETDPTSYHPHLFNTPRNVYLIGFWFNERYFVVNRDQIVSEFTLKKEPSEETQKVAKNISNTDSISLHIRRGDYLKPNLQNRFYVLPIEYYKKGLEYLGQHTTSPKIFVFSDEPQWVMENIEWPFPAEIVSHNGPDRDYEDLWLMTHCRYHIIANSTFSWWGAWLSSFPDKIVIAPEKWFANEPSSRKHMPPEWIRM